MDAFGADRGSRDACACLVVDEAGANAAA